MSAKLEPEPLTLAEVRRWLMLQRLPNRLPSRAHVEYRARKAARRSYVGRHRADLR